MRRQRRERSARRVRQAHYSRPATRRQGSQPSVKCGRRRAVFSVPQVYYYYCARPLWYPNNRRQFSRRIFTCPFWSCPVSNQLVSVLVSIVRRISPLTLCHRHPDSRRSNVPRWPSQTQWVSINDARGHRTLFFLFPHRKSVGRPRLRRNLGTVSEDRRRYGHTLTLQNDVPFLTTAVHSPATIPGFFHPNIVARFSVATINCRAAKHYCPPIYGRPSITRAPRFVYPRATWTHVVVMFAENDRSLFPQIAFKDYRWYFMDAQYPADLKYAFRPIVSMRLLKETRVDLW